MKRNIVTGALILALFVPLSGCTNMNTTQQGALSGGAGGAILGAGIGALAGGPVAGAAIGGAAGLIAGGIYGHSQR